MSHLVPQILVLLEDRWIWVVAVGLLGLFAFFLLAFSEFVTHKTSPLPLLDEAKPRT